MLVVGGTIAVVVIALAAAFYVLTRPKGSSDPGCKSYANTALAAYNKAVDSLNGQASAAAVSADMSAAIADLTSADQLAQSASAKSALGAMLTQLEAVKKDVAAGSVPTSVVKALNTDSTTADNVCS